jgi:hypothetical protein
VNVFHKSFPALFALALLACSSPGGRGVPNFDGASVSDTRADILVPDATTDTVGPQCGSDAQCPTSAPHCVSGACRECASDTQCPESERCLDFACVSSNCTPGTTTCNGSTLLICNDQGNDYNRVACQGECRDGACVGCTPGAVQCDGTSVVRCKPDGSGFELVQTCPAGQTCAGGECLTCYPGQRRCAENGLAQTCSNAGLWETTQDCNAEGLNCNLGQCVSPCVKDPKSRSNSGCDYWAVDLDNHVDAQNGPFALIVSNLYTKKATVTVTRRDGPGTPPAEVARREVEPGALAIFDLPNRNMGAAGVFWSAYRVESTVPIIAYQFNPLDNVDVFSNDASLLIPADTFGREYFVVSRFQFEGGTSDPYLTTPYRGYVSVIASNQATTVTVVPSTRTLAGNNMQSMMAGQSYTYALEPYQVLNIKSDLDKGDLTGTLITSDKPVAVFGGHEAALSGQVCCADHLEHQLYPVATWGTTYVASKSYIRGTESDYWRIIASQDGTTVTFAPAVSQPRTLNRGQHFEITSNTDFVITADKPISVAQTLASSGEVVTPGMFADCSATFACAPRYTCEMDFYSGGYYCKPPSCTMGLPSSCPTGHVCAMFDGFPTCLAVGDPTLIMPPPVKQFRPEYVFLTPNKYAFDYINIVAPTDASVTLDDIVVPPGNFVPVGPANSGWKVARLAVTDGVHKVVATKPVGVTVYGYDRDVSYGYAGGLNLSDE